VRRLLLLPCILVVFTASGALPSATSNELSSFIYVAAHTYQPLAWMHSKERFPQGATLFIQDGSGHRPLIPDFAASADPAVSYDGKRVLFAGKKIWREHWQIWELNLNAGPPRRLTSCPGNCIRPLYLPEDRFVFAEEVRGQMVIKVASLQGGHSLPLTYGAGNSLPSDVLRDGRILFDSVFFSNPATPEIYTVYSDGSGVESYRCDHGPARHSGRQLASGDIVFAREHGLARFTSATAHEIAIPAALQDFAGEIAELPDGDWLLASRSSAKDRFQISRWMPGTPQIKIILSDNRADLIQPTLIAKHTAPNRHPSALHDWNYANLLCLNAYTSKAHLPEGDVANVRLYTRGTSGQATLLGSSTVEKDGSFYLRTPGDRPLKIELLDAAGRTLQKEAGWFWLRRGEQRICVGCHAGPETAPENTVPAVLLRSTVAADMTAGATQAVAGGH
jgi:hypothetical protein